MKVEESEVQNKMAFSREESYLKIKRCELLKGLQLLFEMQSLMFYNKVVDLYSGKKIN